MELVLLSPSVERFSVSHVRGFLIDNIVWPEISTPPYFRIQGGPLSVTDKHTNRYMENLVLNIVFLFVRKYMLGICKVVSDSNYKLIINYNKQKTYYNYP